MDFFRELSLSSTNPTSSSAPSGPCDHAHTTSDCSSTRHDAAAPVSDASVDDVELAPADYERSTVAFYCVVA